MILKHKKAANFARYHNELSKMTNIPEFVDVTNSLAATLPTEDEQNQLKGDLFEIFGEYFIRTVGGHNLLPISRDGYNPNNINDYGIDGIGSYNGQTVAVQFKFKSNPNTPVTYEEMSKFYRQATSPKPFGYGINPANVHEQMVVITTALNFSENEMDGGAIHPFLINRDSLEHLIGQNNLSFWLSFVESLVETYESEVKPPNIMKLWRHQEDAINKALAYLDDPGRRHAECN